MGNVIPIWVYIPHSIDYDKLSLYFTLLSADNPKAWVNILPTALVVCITQVNCNTGKSPYELVYGQKPALVSTTTGPQLPLPKKVPDNSDPNVQRARKDQEDMEQKKS
ncbi:hypothetical protein DSO57_1003476 [Entomophthora muscae]|uniref:Uncharacterized protein n=1 Tax=Entomophthora muscae TaxID=34485 RepID=A0ACC2UTJ4_9FUNG|nr:hypothetical protein DSO57_1003476 [Entomophthora muscae]